MSKLTRKASDREGKGLNDRPPGAVSVYNRDNREEDITTGHRAEYLVPTFVDSKDGSSGPPKIPSEQSTSSNVMFNEMQAETATAPVDNMQDDVMIVRTAAMGPYPMSLLASGSPMNKSITSSTSGSICRICLEGDCVEELISPCDCMGSMGVVHICCLEKWLSTSNLDRCEVCKFQFKVRRTPRPIVQWLFSRQIRDGPHGFCGDALCLLLLTPICLTSVYLCGMGSLSYLQHRAWEGVGLAFLSLIVLFTFFLWGFTTIRFQWQSMNRWRMSNQTVRLVDQRARRRRQLGGGQCNAHRSPPTPPSHAIP